MTSVDTTTNTMSYGREDTTTSGQTCGYISPHTIEKRSQRKVIRYFSGMSLEESNQFIQKFKKIQRDFALLREIKTEMSPVYLEEVIISLDHSLTTDDFLFRLEKEFIATIRFELEVLELMSGLYQHEGKNSEKEQNTRKIRLLKTLEKAMLKEMKSRYSTI